MNLDVLTLFSKAAKVQVHQTIKRDERIDIAEGKISRPFGVNGEEVVQLRGAEEVADCAMWVLGPALC